MSTLIKEAATATATEVTGSRQLIALITPGWGSSGYYSAEVLEQAAIDRVFPKGTRQHIDHDGEMARYEQPVGSISTLAAALAEDARWDPDYVHPKTGEKGALLAESDVFPSWRADLKAMKDVIGNSIVASAVMSEGEVDGRKGMVVEKLLPSRLNRVDYVTAEGRGGHISAVLESALARHAVEATANETRELIRTALRAAYGEDNTWVWLRDHDNTTAWFEVEDADTMAIYQQAYALTDNLVTLTGDRIEVRATTQYMPVANTTEAHRTVTKNSPPVPAGATQKKEDAPMATTQIEEAELATLRESASRAVTVEAELAEARTQLAAAETARTQATAEAIVAEAFGETEAKVTRAALITAALAAESFDADKLKADATEAAAEIAVTHGAGTPRGLGETVVESKTITDDDIVNAL